MCYVSKESGKFVLYPLQKEFMILYLEEKLLCTKFVNAEEILIYYGDIFVKMKINAKNYEYSKGKLQIYYNIFECNAFMYCFI